MKLDYKKIFRLKYILFGFLLFILIFSSWFYFSLPEVTFLKNENPKTTALMELRKEQAKEAGKKFRLRQKWVRFQKIPELLKKAVRITEDSDFYGHEGIDWVELQESIKKNFEKGGLARGGSTITQQLAKNLFLSTEKSFFRKFRELFITYRLENEISKNRIFHLYLNIIEFGPGVFGVQAASRYYFKKDVSVLTLPQIVRLTAVIPKPLSVKASGNSRWLKWKARWILGKLKLYKYITVEQYNSAITEFKK
ncbi:MAG: monofunctional biosynthetic peptidoglycan transglycosylase [Calditrichaeota bacterium]|nr:MAG: monofunctional biosynthetic peptidoglycan transglycosylase [Calditrichota bacterium]MBL1206739.1 monofunctional biosynthetic peptidoglycan transglycosylase [Calditrichota bacterium]NOG46565.1 monofunctional biosynthetic peptidoglycan transglycosylase [Calditrichota bacterium]